MWKCSVRVSDIKHPADGSALSGCVRIAKQFILAHLLTEMSMMSEM